MKNYLINTINIIELLANSDDVIREEAAFFIASSGNSNDAKILLPFLETERNANVIKAMLYALGKCGGESIFPMLLEYAKHPDQEIRIVAIEGLQQCPIEVVKTELFNTSVYLKRQ